MAKDKLFKTEAQVTFFAELELLFSLSCMDVDTVVFSHGNGQLSEFNSSKQQGSVRLKGLPDISADSVLLAGFDRSAR